jgi:hypothetical protein
MILTTIMMMALAANTTTPEGVALLLIILTHLSIRLLRALIPAIRSIVSSAGSTETGLTVMNLARVAAVGPKASPPPESLCVSCVFAHVVRGYERGEEIIACGFAFPPRDMLFAVRECTDHKPKRESSGAENAYEGTVSLPSFVVTATHFRAAVAAREACGA